MKKVILALTFVPMVGFAGIEDFNSLINENAKTQSQLQEQLQGKAQATRKALGTGRKTMVLVHTETLNSPTSDKALKFEKEKIQHVPSKKKDLERLADEINSIKEY